MYIEKQGVFIGSANTRVLRNLYLTKLHKGNNKEKKGDVLPCAPYVDGCLGCLVFHEMNEN